MSLILKDNLVSSIIWDKINTFWIENWIETSVSNKMGKLTKNITPNKIFVKQRKSYNNKKYKMERERESVCVYVCVCLKFSCFVMCVFDHKKGWQFLTMNLKWKQLMKFHFSTKQIPFSTLENTSWNCSRSSKVRAWTERQCNV